MIANFLLNLVFGKMIELCHLEHVYDPNQEFRMQSDDDDEDVQNRIVEDADLANQ
jgi:hypothetical protein